MVRYNEFNQPIIEDTPDIHVLLKKHFKFSNNDKFVEGVNYNILNGKVNVFIDSTGGDSNLVMRPEKSTGRIPIPFGKVECSFICRDCRLNTLENAPEIMTLHYYLMVEGNNLTSLSSLTTKNIFWVHCSGNPLTSLEGLTTETNIKQIRLTYDPTLPMLRLLCLKSIEFAKYDNDDIIFQYEYRDLREIIYYHIKTYPNIKERIYKCQYAMIKAGYKGNAKW